MRGDHFVELGDLNHPAPPDPATAVDRLREAIVVPINAHYGRADMAVWQWLEVKSARDR